jgi:hypothetical protein
LRVPSTGARVAEGAAGAGRWRRAVAFGVGIAAAFRAIGRVTAGFRVTAFFAKVLTTLRAGLATFLAFLAAAGLAAFCGRFPLARVDADERPSRRRAAAFGAGRRRAFRAVFARALSDFFDFLDFAGLAARLGAPARRPFARLAFALAMTLLVCPPLVTEPVGCRAAV